MLGIGIARIVTNSIGAIVRWVYGTIWRALFNKPKFTFQEYINGPKNSDDSFDVVGHQFNNRMIGAVFIGLIVSIIIKYT